MIELLRELGAVDKLKSCVCYPITLFATFKPEFANVEVTNCIQHSIEMACGDSDT